MMRICVIVCIIMCMFHYAYGAWTPIGPYGGDIHSIVISPTNGDLIWMMSNENPAKVVTSTDGGATWTTVGDFYGMGNLGEDKDFAVDFLNNDNIYAVYGRNFISSSDGGINWNIDSTTGFCFNSIVVHPENSNILYGTGYCLDTTSLAWQIAFQKSTDAGETWTYNILNNVSYWSFGYDITISALNPDIILISGMTITYIPLLFISIDGGLNFTDISSSFPTGTLLYALGINPENAEIIYACSSIGFLYRSTDGGITWESDDLTAEILYTIDICLCNPDIIYCGGKPYVYVSTDGGITWAVSDSGLTASKYYGVATHPSNPNIAYAGCSTGVYKTTDCGLSWSLCNTNLNLVTINDFCIAPANPSIMYVTTEDFGMYKSTNYGTSWSLLPDITNCGNICDLAVNPYNSDVVLGLETHG